MATMPPRPRFPAPHGSFVITDLSLGLGTGLAVAAAAGVIALASSGPETFANDPIRIEAIEVSVGSAETGG